MSFLAARNNQGSGQKNTDVDVQLLFSRVCFLAATRNQGSGQKKMLMLAIGQLLSNCARKRASGAADTGANVSKPQIIVSKYAKSQKGKY